MSKARPAAGTTGRRGVREPMFLYEGWYAITATPGEPSFWAAWWTAEPMSSPWRTPDATGSGSQPEAVLAAEAQRRIRAAKGLGALVREVDASWARAARREAAGEAPRYRAPPPPRKPRSEFERPPRTRTRDSPRQQARARAAEAEWKALCAPIADFAMLGLPVTATVEEIGRAYRRKVARERIHPDHGGDAATFRAVTTARDRALAHAGSALPSGFR